MTGETGVFDRRVHIPNILIGWYPSQCAQNTQHTKHTPRTEMCSNCNEHELWASTGCLNRVSSVGVLTGKDFGAEVYDKKQYPKKWTRTWHSLKPKTHKCLNIKFISKSKPLTRRWSSCKPAHSTFTSEKLAQSGTNACCTQLYLHSSPAELVLLL